MNFSPQNKQQAVDVNLTPLIDVVFLLLIFFMVTTTFDENAAIKIMLPEATDVAPSTKEKHLALVIDSKGRYYIDGKEVLNNKPETLFRAMNETLDKLGTAPIPPLVISADATADYQYVVTAMDIAGRVGITNFSMATMQAKNTSPTAK